MMDNGKYVNYYVDTMTQTMNEFLSQSISLKANSKIIEESLHEQIRINEELRLELEKANLLIEQKEKDFAEKQSEEIGSLYYELDVSREQKLKIEKQLSILQSEVNSLRSINENIRVEHDNLVSQAQHVETFRNELLKARNENDELRKTIDALTIEWEKDVRSVVDSYESKNKPLKEQIKKLENPELDNHLTNLEINTPVTKQKTVSLKKTNPIKDGGTF
jgi:chromosome segregation ATPase